MARKKKQSGTKRGRPPGSRDWRLGLADSKIEKLKRKLLSMALKGDMRAMQICADRLWARVRPVSPPVKVETGSSDPAAQGAAIIGEALSGRLSPDVLRELLGALADLTRLREFGELEGRLTALERGSDTPPWLKQPPPDRELLPIRGRKRRNDERQD